MKNLSLRLDEKDYKILDINCKALGVTKNEFVRKLIRSSNIKNLEDFKRQMEEETRLAISKYRGMVKNSLYGVLIGSVLFLMLISYGYFTNIRYIKGQVEEMATKNNLLATRINQIHWIIAEDNKFWYDKENKVKL